jgi:hypothetical protein
MTGTAVEARERLSAQRSLTAGTTQRFVVLLVLFAVSGLQLSRGLIQNPQFPGVQGHVDEAYGCILAAGVNPSAAGIQLYLPTLRYGQAFQTCEAHYGWTPAWWPPYAITAGFVIVTALTYLLLASGRRRVVPVADIDPDRELTTALAELTVIAALARPPRFVVDPTAAVVGAAAYGLPRRHTVCLNGGLVATLRSSPGTFRAVVLHELAHLRNRDVGLTYATIAAWRVYLVALLVPSSFSMVWLVLAGPLFGRNAQSVFLPAVRTGEIKSLVASAFLVLLVYLARADALRTREAYADLDAACWGASVGTLGEGLLKPGPLAAFWQLWRTHPGWQQRAVLPADASAVFRVSSLQMFLTGAAAVLIASDVNAGGYWASAVAGVVVAAVAGVALWRAVAYAVLTRRTAPSTLLAGLWLGIGLVSGELLVGYAGFLHWLPVAPEFLLPLILLGIIVTEWFSELAAWCAALAGRSRWLTMAAGLAAIGFVVPIWLMWWNGIGSLSAIGMPVASNAILHILEAGLPGPILSGQHGLLVVITALLSLPAAQAWLITAAAVALWTVPLATWAVRVLVRHAPVPAPWLRFAVLAGCGGAAGSVAGCLAVMRYLHSWRIPVEQRLGSFLLVYFGLLMICVIGGMVLAGAGGAVLARESRVLGGLLATGVAAPIGLAGSYLVIAGDGCVAPLATMVNSCSWKPALAWDWVHTFAAAALAVGTVAATVGVVLVVAGAEAVTKWRVKGVARSRGGVVLAGGSGATPMRPLTRGWGLRAGRIATATVLTLVSVAMLVGAGPSLGGVGTGAAATSTDVNEILPASAGAANSQQLTGVMVAAWIKFGGQSLLSAFAHDYSTLGNSTERLAAELGPGQTVSVSSGRFRALATPVATACRALQRKAQDAEAYFPIPSLPLQADWQGLIAHVNIDAHNCETGAAKPNPQLLTSSLTELYGQEKALAQLVDQLLSVYQHFCRACV